MNCKNGLPEFRWADKWRREGQGSRWLRRVCWDCRRMRNTRPQWSGCSRRRAFICRLSRRMRNRCSWAGMCWPTTSCATPTVIRRISRCITPSESLEKFFKSRLGISPRDYAAMVEQLCDSAVAVGREMIEVSKNETRWRDITAQMLHAWNDGMASLRSVRSETSSASHSAIRIFPDTHAALTR